MANMCQLGIDRTGLYHGLDPLTALSAMPEFYQFRLDKCVPQNAGCLKVAEGKTHISQVILQAGVTDQAIRMYAKRHGYIIADGMFDNNDAICIIEHYANRNKQ